jgi:hypothetical protein
MRLLLFGVFEKGWKNGRELHFLRFLVEGFVYQLPVIYVFSEFFHYFLALIRVGLMLLLSQKSLFKRNFVVLLTLSSNLSKLLFLCFEIFEDFI